MCRCVCIIMLWVGVTCLSLDVCIYSSCPFLIYFVFMLIRYNDASFFFFFFFFFFLLGGGGGGYGTI